MRNLFMFFAGVVFSCSVLALSSRVIWGEPIGIDSLRPTHPQGKAAVQEEVRAKKFVLVDEQGMSVGAFGTTNGQPRLALYGESEKVRALFALDPSGQPGLALFSESQKARAFFALDTNGQPGVVLFGENGKPRAKFIMQKGEPRLTLLDGVGKVSFQTPQ